MALVEVVGGQAMVKAPGAPDAHRCCLRGSWTAACMYVSEGQGGPWWWWWMAGCSSLVRTGWRRKRRQKQWGQSARKEGREEIIDFKKHNFCYTGAGLTIVYESVWSIVRVRIVIICRGNVQRADWDARVRTHTHPFESVCFCVWSCSNRLSNLEQTTLYWDSEILSSPQNWSIFPRTALCLLEVFLHSSSSSPDSPAHSLMSCGSGIIWVFWFNNNWHAKTHKICTHIQAACIHTFCMKWPIIWLQHTVSVFHFAPAEPHLLCELCESVWT